jgi:choline transport protein
MDTKEAYYTQSKLSRQQEREHHEENLDQKKEDLHDMAAMGHVQELTRKFNIWSMLALAFSVLGTWSTFAQDLASGLTTGGPVSILWGLALVTVCNVCVAVSLGELCSSMPTALGQAYWIYRLWNTPTGRVLSYFCAWINTFGWWTLTASQNAFMSSFVLAPKVMYDVNWNGVNEGWLSFVVYVGITLVFTLVNVVACRNDKVLPWFNNVVGIQFGTLFFVFCLALLISTGINKDLHYESAKFVFGQWINQTGWPNGVTWFTGLIQAAYGLTAFDSVIHMVEEIPAPKKNAPKVIYLAVIMGAVSGGLFMVVCLFCIQDLDGVINTATGLPFVQLLLDTIGLQGSVALVILFLINGLGQGVSILTTASRLTWGFARDGGLPFSGYFSRVDPVWKVPVRALWGQGVLIALVGVLYLFASTVLEAILSVSTIALTISYAMPIVALLVVGRDKLQPGPFSLGKFWGPICNWVSIVYCSITTVFFFFPSAPDPTGGSMNYAIAVFGVMLVVAVIFWFVKGKNSYLQTDEALMEILQAQYLEDPLPPTVDPTSDSSITN